jgi:hypothetical protein
MSQVRLLIDVHSRVAEFSRTIHPMDVGDLEAARRTLDKAYLEARSWLDHEIGKPIPLPTRSKEPA